MHSTKVRALVLGSLWLLTALVTMPLWDWTYWDFGDGNYLYVGRRILDGLVPYRDILAPQPPLHLLGSAFAQGIGNLLFDSALIGARLYCLVVRLLGSLAVYLAAQRLFRCDFRATVAAALWLAMPIGFWWGLCVQSENLENVFLILAFWAILSLERKPLAFAGVCSALAMHCNMTAVPFFLCNLIFLAARRPRLLAWYALPALGVWGVGALGAWMWAGEAYWSNVVFNQVGSFPRTDILAADPAPPNTFAEYAVGKVVSQGREILRLEGPMIAMALAAMGVRWVENFRRLERNGDEYRRWEYAAWYCIGMMLSVGFTMKGGTVNYIFVLGEPAVAILAADGIVRLLRLALRPETNLALRIPCFMAVLLTVAWMPAWENLKLTVGRQQVELPAEDHSRGAGPQLPGVLSLRHMIEERTQPGDPILAPPFYAWVSGRTVAGELAENYLWNIKVGNETFDRIEGEGVLKMQEIAGMLRRREIPLVILDTVQTGRDPWIRAAIEQNYDMIGKAASRHVPLELYVPKP